MRFQTAPGTHKQTCFQSCVIQHTTVPTVPYVPAYCRSLQPGAPQYPSETVLRRRNLQRYWLCVQNRAHCFSSEFNCKPSHQFPGPWQPSIQATGNPTHGSCIQGDQSKALHRKLGSPLVVGLGCCPSAFASRSRVGSWVRIFSTLSAGPSSD